MAVKCAFRPYMDFKAVPLGYLKENFRCNLIPIPVSYTHLAQEAYRRDDTRGRPLRLPRRALFLAERVFKCQNRSEED